MQELEDPPICTLAKPLQKQQRTSQAGAAVEDTCDQEATSSVPKRKINPIKYWIRKKSWPREYFKQDDQTRRDLEKDSWIKDFKDQEWLREQFGDISRMSKLLAKQKSSSSLCRKNSESDTATPSDQKPREARSIQYARPSYETILATKGSFMGKSDFGITDTSKGQCRALLEAEQSVPQDTLFRDDLFDETCESVQARNEAIVVRDISPLICPSAQVLRIYGSKHLKPLIESVNEGWTSAISFYGPRPQPNYSVGFGRSAFTDDQLEKLKHLVGEITDSFTSYFMATWRMYFPFLTCEVKCGAAALDVADRQNAHSMTLAVRGVVELFRLVKREKELHQEILAFSISHDHSSVRIYGHYPVIDGPNTTFYRHPIKKFDFTSEDGKEKWTAYKFVKNLYNIWMPTHFKRICSVINELPPDLDFEVSELQFSEEPGPSQPLEQSLLQKSNADSVSLMGKDIQLPNPKDFLVKSLTSTVSLENNPGLPDPQKMWQDMGSQKRQKLPSKVMLQQGSDWQRQKIDQLRREKEDQVNQFMQQLELQRREIKRENDELKDVVGRLTRQIDLLLKQQELLVSQIEKGSNASPELQHSEEPGLSRVFRDQSLSQQSNLNTTSLAKKNDSQQNPTDSITSNTSLSQASQQPKGIRDAESERGYFQATTKRIDYHSATHAPDLELKIESCAILYVPLNEDKDEIRLISFPPEFRQSGLVHCHLETVSLKSYTLDHQAYLSSVSSETTKRKVLADWARIQGLPNSGDDAMDSRVPLSGAFRFQWGDYAALSYVWGNENLTSTIIVDGREIQVTQNLEVALRALRERQHFEERFKLWVDALCINQRNYEERASQVKKMQNIYGNAWMVITWLGNEENESDKAIDLILILSNANSERRVKWLESKLTNEPNYIGIGSWLALHELMQRPYWTRVWIIQEIVLGSSGVLILCGRRSIEWTSFCEGIRVLYNNFWTTKDRLLAHDVVICKSSIRPPWKILSLHLVYRDLRI